MATVNADLRVGSLEETITVTGESPIVDVQSAKQQQVLTRELIEAIPTGRVYHSLVALVPGITSRARATSGASADPQSSRSSIHGGRFTEGRLQVDGMSTGAAVGGSGTSYYVADVGNAQEMTFTTSGGMGEAETGGPVMSIVPRHGGNVINGIVLRQRRERRHPGQQLHPGVEGRGAAAPGELQKIWDVNGTLGGPLRERQAVVRRDRALPGQPEVRGGHVLQQERGQPGGVDLRARPDPPGDRRRHWKALGLRLTWQATPSTSSDVFWDETSVCVNCIGGGSSTTSPEAAGTTMGFPHRVQQVSWTSPMTNRLLLEAGFGTYLSWYGGKEREGNDRDLIRVTEQAGIIPGLLYRSQDWSRPYSKTLTWRASASYVTGAHSMKVGAIGNYYRNKTDSYTNNHRLAYRFNNGVPNQLTMSGLRFITDSHTQPTGIYAQEQWTLGRLTLQGGIRYDRATSGFPDQQLGPERFIPVPILFPRRAGSSYNDISPRFGRRLRSARQREDGGQGDSGPVRRSGERGGHLLRTQSDQPARDVHDRSWTDANGNYRRRLRSAQPGAAGPSWRRR